MITGFFTDYLINTQTRIANFKNSFRFLLDKNEQTADIDIAFKQAVVSELMKNNWNRYPDSNYQDIEEKIAEYCNLEAENIILSPGSASIITTLLNYFALNNKEIIITQPTYSLFDYHCKTYNIKYTPWLLSEDLEYDYDNIPKLNSNSVLIITSPNNPVGNTFDINYLEFILNLYPKALVIVDGVYTEFSNQDFTPLIKKYNNLIVLRSFSKAFPVAGLRLGYLCAAKETTSIIKKLFLQFSISQFSLIFARKLLFNEEFIAMAKSRVKVIIQDRNKLGAQIKSCFDRSEIQVFDSCGNFILLRIHNKEKFNSTIQQFLKDGIKILDTSSFPLLENTFRVSVGNRSENEQFLRSLKQGMVSETKYLQPAFC